MDDLARDPGLSKKISELLTSKLNEKNLIEKGAKLCYFRSRENSFLQYLVLYIDITYGLTADIE